VNLKHPEELQEALKMATKSDIEALKATTKSDIER
jgi:hypothetical protein